MNGTRDIDDTAASDPGGSFDPREAAGCSIRPRGRHDAGWT